MSTKRYAYLTEMRTQLSLAVPALLAQVAMISMGFVDMVMTGRVGPVDMAAVALAGSLWVPLVLFGQGLLMAITPCVAQLRGAGAVQNSEHLQGVGHVMRQGLWMALAIAVPLILVVYALSFHLSEMGVEGELGVMTGQYLRAIVWGAPAYLLFVALRCGMEGMALMRPAMFAGFMGLFINIPSNYVLIFGKLGLPALGGPGTGVATAIVYWVMFLTMVMYACRHPQLRVLLAPRAWERPVWGTLKKLAGIGFPGALAMLCEVTLFAAVALLIAPLGAIQVAGHQVALNFSSLLFMVPLSIGTAATIRTGFALGRKSVEAVRVASRSSWLLACMAAVCTAGITVAWRQQIAAVYNDDPVVLALASHLLLFAATYQFTDAIQVVSVGILRGYNDTRAILGVTLVSYWVFALPVGYTLGRTHLWGEPLGPQGFWTAFIVGVSIAAVLLFIRVLVLERRLKSGFERIRVMEG
ncbi:MAG TPA: MATE family efflux transporter [Candidatus Bilophila faecipullorum]|uniref:MATE family efflux transporter n=1 Tax=Candidatus Bilophila faecipullorum TaxID=2838482 RepID=A0A9D1UAY2_9BACT|nr:MATE family efflux transporter [uncultured Bilophila sp.]HIW79740.1 MATE family efflux transporter [Candidatus Bilophila faecipullorum]